MDSRPFPCRIRFAWPRPSLVRNLVVLAAFSLLCPVSDAAEDVAVSSSNSQKLEFFENHIRPFLIEHCIECHSTADPNGGLRLDSRSGWMAGGDSGSAIEPGDAYHSRLITAIRYDDPNLQMPPSGPLPKAEVKLLEQWIADGAFDPRELAAENPSAQKRPTGMSPDEGRQFWSFQPVQQPTVPDLQADPWIRNPIDAFVREQTNSNNLTPAPESDRSTQIRRITYNLIGLPPTPAQLTAFLADTRPDAYERLVDALLDSPQYGERWGRHWLDVARYADSNGLDENLAFGTAWRYRDYVINSFNSDKPFDQFIVEQIAGDLLPTINQETKTATGFLVLGAKVLAEPDREKLTMDTIDEQVDTVGKAFLGLTLGCARCHDHKFDPILQSDYYALAVIFKSTKTFGDTNFGAIKHWHEHPFATEAERQEIAQVKNEIAAKKAAANSFKSQAMAKVRTTAQANAANYLAASALIPAGASLVEVSKVADQFQLHPRILHHCRTHLDFNRGQPFFAQWHQLIEAAYSPEQLQTHYSEIFSQAKATEGKPQAANKSSDANLSDAQLDLVQHAWNALNDASGFLAVPPQPEFALDLETLEQYYTLLEEARIFESSAPDLPSAMGVSEAQTLTSLPIHIRGSHRNLGEPIERRFPKVFDGSISTPVFPRHQSGRLELANWIASTSNPLTARVIVNRVWRWHFGTGLVETTENFGVMGDAPSHPRLLDWLAHHFMESGWSIKHLHRLILNSSTYRQSSLHPLDGQQSQIDPENKTLWKFPLQRLDAEQIRDAILFSGNRLDQSTFGKTVPLRNRQFVFDHTSIDHTRYESLRRAIYLPVIRNNVYTFFEQFDFPDPTTPTGNRHATVVAPQALLLLNDNLVVDAAEDFATRVCRDAKSQEDRIGLAYEIAFSRPPTAAELDTAKDFIGDATDDSHAWSLFCHGLLASNEFIYLR